VTYQKNHGNGENTFCHPVSINADNVIHTNDAKKYGSLDFDASQCKSSWTKGNTVSFSVL